MALIHDYGSLAPPPASRGVRGHMNMKLLACVAALAALALVAVTTLATQEAGSIGKTSSDTNELQPSGANQVAQHSRKDNGMTTLAEFNKQEMKDMLSRAKTMSTAQLQREVSELEAEKQDGETRTQALVTVNENTAGNPEGGVLEYVPATVVGPVDGPPDFNGASAVVARLPNIGFAPSLLTEKGFETRGSFTVRKSRAGESFYLRVYGKLNHNIRCTLRGYRNLMGDFTGNTIYTGFKKIYTGKSQIQTGHVPRGIVGEFDIMTCRDLGNGEVQYFRIRYS